MARTQSWTNVGAGLAPPVVSHAPPVVSHASPVVSHAPPVSQGFGRGHDGVRAGQAPPLQAQQSCLDVVEERVALLRPDVVLGQLVGFLLVDLDSVRAEVRYVHQVAVDADGGRATEPLLDL